MGGTKKTKQKGGFLPVGLLSAVGGTVLGAVAKPILKKISGRKINRKAVAQFIQKRRTRYV